MRDNLKFYVCDDNNGFADRIKKEIDLCRLPRFDGQKKV